LKPSRAAIRRAALPEGENSRLNAFWRVFPDEKPGFLKALTLKRGQLAEARKRLPAQLNAHGKLGSADMLDAIDAETANILRAVPGIGPLTSSMLIAEMPELGRISGEQAAALTGLAPIAHDSGAMRGGRSFDTG
jgi:transposase